MPWLSDSSALAREQHLGVSMTTGITMNSDFATNRFDRESVAMLVQGGSHRRGEVGHVCLTSLNAVSLPYVSRNSFIGWRWWFMVSARGAGPILTALITCVRLAHMWSVVRWPDSWD